ncbi:hypothetical protein ADIS_2296 [Lunatimonas lonarensis]|jgi:hypothetical protein|uniref:Lipoprotein n=1 Tax=Lunatimonas lonarensis TaxID=1232681 RepID=R7ZST7_9BACT|nr:hypothetical protein ADIS_2296 [Lunatimonas lonarensis]
MQKVTVLLLLVGLLAVGACASSKPCPAYAKSEPVKEIRG